MPRTDTLPEPATGTAPAAPGAARPALDWRQYVVVDPQFYRPGEEVILVANAAKAQRELGWQPETSFEELVRTMVDADMESCAISEMKMSA